MTGLLRKKTSAERSRVLSHVVIEGYKSILQPTRLDFGSLTILAGANSSGKSSIMQPLLLLKQTLDVPSDPGALKLEGPNVCYTDLEQFISKQRLVNRDKSFSITVGIENASLRFCFQKTAGNIDVKDWRISYGKSEYSFSTSCTESEVRDLITNMQSGKIFFFYFPKILIDDVIAQLSNQRKNEESKLSIQRKRFFPYVTISSDQFIDRQAFSMDIPLFQIAQYPMEMALKRMIHLPGLRGNPERVYMKRTTGPEFGGLFQDYVASIISKWAITDSSKENIDKLSDNLRFLELTSHVSCNVVSDTQIEVRVGRLFEKTKRTDEVNIADVGFGVSQSLPVLVALLVAQPGQVVYLEQPEIHLHPRAQEKLADLLVEAANRGVQVVTETHSALLLLAIRRLIAEKRIKSDEIKLHWFSRNKRTGQTNITPAELDDKGRFGNWPEDFSDVSMEADSKYIKAVFGD